MVSLNLSLRARSMMFATDNTHAERGSSLIEIFFVISLVVALTAGTYALSKGPGSVASSALALPRLFDEARALAATSGDGATVVLVPQKTGSGARAFDVMLYRYRPRADASPTPGRSTAGIVLDRSEHMMGSLATSATADGPVAIFISTSGTVSYAAWTPRAGPLAQEPACTAPLELTISAGPTAADFQLPCDQATLTRQLNGA